MTPYTGLCEVITVSYLDRPPYYYTKGGKPRGFLIELSKYIFLDAGIKVVFKEMPPKRIMHELKNRYSLHCSVGWFKKKEREAFAKFSLPIYQNKPIEILTTKKNKPLFKNYTELKQVFLDKGLSMGTISTFSYGVYIDKLMKEFSPNFFGLTVEQSTLPKLISKGRISYMLIAPEECDILIRNAGFRRDKFLSIKMADIPEGNKRYLIFNKNIRDDIIKRVNLSIRKLVSFNQ